MHIKVAANFFSSPLLLPPNKERRSICDYYSITFNNFNTNELLYGARIISYSFPPHLGCNSVDYHVVTLTRCKECTEITVVYFSSVSFIGIYCA